jgi:hypothetical protein
MARVCGGLGVREEYDLAGQWIGYGEGSPAGDVMLDLDPIGEEAVGRGYLFLNANWTSEIPSSSIQFRSKRFSKTGEFSINPEPFDARIGYRLNASEMRQYFPDSQMPQNSSLSYRFESINTISAAWKSDIGTFGSAKLVRRGSKRSSYPHVDKTIRTWSDYKAYVSARDPQHTIYRGQDAPHPLQTTFHRTSRKDLTRYVDKDVPTLHRALSSKTRHFFDLNQPQQMGAFLNLAQHHGFPTPLLDWSYSPYVAAYFAFSSVDQKKSLSGHVRIFCLDKETLVTSTPQFQHLTYVYPHLSVLEALSIENDRAVPQQGLLTLTNVQDIEWFLHVMEIRIGKQLLTVIDLPKSETASILSELRLMGITRSSLFPGIESICLDTKGRLF